MGDTSSKFPEDERREILRLSELRRHLEEEIALAEARLRAREEENAVLRKFGVLLLIAAVIFLAIGLSPVNFVSLGGAACAGATGIYFLTLAVREKRITRKLLEKRRQLAEAVRRVREIDRNHQPPPQNPPPDAA